MRISDWSSDVCSSDLSRARNGRGERPGCSAGSAFCQGGRQGRRRRSECRNGQQGRGRDSGKRGRGPIVRLDITDAASWAGAVEAAVGVFGKLTTPYNTAGIIHGDRKSVVLGKSVSVRVDHGGPRIIKKNKNIKK